MCLYSQVFKNSNAFYFRYLHSSSSQEKLASQHQPLRRRKEKGQGQTRLSGAAGGLKLSDDTGPGTGFPADLTASPCLLGKTVLQLLQKGKGHE